MHQVNQPDCSASSLAENPALCPEALAEHALRSRRQHRSAAVACHVWEMHAGHQTLVAQPGAHVHARQLVARRWVNRQRQADWQVLAWLLLVVNALLTRLVSFLWCPPAAAPAAGHRMCEQCERAISSPGTADVLMHGCMMSSRQACLETS